MDIFGRSHRTISSGTQKDQFEHASEPRGRLQGRFYFHTLCGIVFPLAFAVFYVWTNVFWLQPSSNPVANTGWSLPNGKYIWWAWFVIGAVGLNISNYTLAGVEAAMIRNGPFEPNRAQFMHHTGKSWSTLGAWKIVGGKILTPGKGDPLGRLWFMLFGLTVLSWVFVLSGLTMETFDGYKAGSTPGATVVGINQAAMANRPTFGLVEAANQQWALGSIPQIPLAAAIYVPPGSNIKPNVSTPNSLPANASMGVFLAPQANVPITGDIWGLQFKLSCIGVERLDQFTILNRRVNSSNPEYATSEMIGEKDIHFYYRLDDGSTISVLSSFALITDSLAYVEIGSRYETLVDNPDRWGYSCGGGSCTGDPMDLTYAGMDEEEVFEYVLWQAFQPVPGQIPKKPQPRQYPIPELENERRPVNDTLLRTPWTEPVQAIGVRCTSSSAMGTAKVNGFSGHFEDFRREDPPVGRSLATNIPRLSNGIPLMFLPANEENWASFLNYGAEFPTDLLGNISGTIQYVTFNDTPADWLARLAVAAHQKRNTSTTAQHLLYYDNLIQTQGLLDAIVSAYHHYAVQIMFLNDNTPTDYWTHYGITASVPWSLLRASSNGVAPLFVVIVMMIWAVACSGLSLAFGFRRRLASTCDYAYIQEYQQTFPEAITTVEVQRQETIARKL